MAGRCRRKQWTWKTIDNAYYVVCRECGVHDGSVMHSPEAASMRALQLTNKSRAPKAFTPATGKQARRAKAAGKRMRTITRAAEKEITRRLEAETTTLLGLRSFLDESHPDHPEAMRRLLEMEPTHLEVPAFPGGPQDKLVVADEEGHIIG